MLQWLPIVPISQVEMCSVGTFLRFGLASTRKRVLKPPKSCRLLETVSRANVQSGDFEKRRLLVYVWTDEKIVTVI